jgi:hypothetical protein
MNDSRTRKEAERISSWSAQILELLRRLITRLSDIVMAWDRFKQKDMGYFLFDDDNGSRTSSSPLKSSVNFVDHCFLDLKDILKKLCHLEDDLRKNSHVSHLSWPKLKANYVSYLTDTDANQISSILLQVMKIAKLQFSRRNPPAISRFSLLSPS